MTKKSRSRLSRLLGFVGVLILVGSVFAVALAIVFNGVFKTPALSAAGAPQSADLQLSLPTSTPLSLDMTLLDLYTQKGKLVAQGTNAAPVGVYHLTTYRIEEFTLSKPMTITRNNQTQQVSQAWRVTIGGGPFHVRAQGYVIWVNDTSLGFAQESRDLSEISVVIFDRALLPNGAALAVSYDERPGRRVVLPDKLKWSNGVFKTPALSAAGAPQSADLQLSLPTSTPLSPDMTLLDLYTQKGKLVAQGTNAVPVGVYHLTTYRIEEFTLSKPMTITRNNQTQQVSQAWRITIHGGPFNLGALNYVIWVNDTLLGRARQSRDLSEISAVVFERSVLPNGAALAVSYGESPAGRIVLPDKLKWSNGVFKTPALPSVGAPQSADLQPGTPIPTPLSPDMTLLDLYTQKGKLVAQGTNAVPVGVDQITTYRIEEFTLSKPMTITRNNQTQQVSQAWRITIHGGPFNLGALNYVIWVNDTSLGPAWQSRNSEISVVIFDRALLPNGAALAVSYDEHPGRRVVLPDKLKWSDAP